MSVKSILALITQLAKKASKIDPETCGDVQTVDDCHENYPARRKERLEQAVASELWPRN